MHHSRWNPYGINALDAALTSRLVVKLFDTFPVIAAVIVLAVGHSPLVSCHAVPHQRRQFENSLGTACSVGVKWMVMVLTAAMALEQLGIGGQIVTCRSRFCWRIVLALALALGLGSKDMVSRSWEQDRGEDEGEGLPPLIYSTDPRSRTLSRPCNGMWTTEDDY